MFSFLTFWSSGKTSLIRNKRLISKFMNLLISKSHAEIEAG